MEEKFKSEGKCLFCNKTFTKAGISRHVATHLKEKSETEKSGNSFLLKVETTKRWSSSPYFLSLWVDGEATMKTIDKFLRDIWLECCGHMSAFRNPKIQHKRGKVLSMTDVFDYLERRSSVKNKKMMESSTGEVPMVRKAKDALYSGLVLEYDYDFGSTTKLDITVIGEYQIKADKKVVLVSRNEPLQIVCAICKKVPATQICTICMYNEHAEFCERCAPKHAKKCADFEDYASMPVVNSPRMGVCGYVGGRIDKERDR